MMSDTSTHEQMAEEELLARERKDVHVGPLDVLTDHLQQVVCHAEGGYLTTTGMEDLPFETEQLAVRLLRASERAQGADLSDVTEAHVRSLLRAVGAPTRKAKQITRRVCDFLRGLDAGRL